MLCASVFILYYSAPISIPIPILPLLFDIRHLVTNLTFIQQALSFSDKIRPYTFSIRTYIFAKMHLKFSLTLSSSLWLLSNAAAIPTAGNEPGNFSDVLCSDGDIGNPAASAALRWSEADVSDAWDAVERYWNENPASAGLNFVQAVSHYWNGPESWNCGAVGSDPCDSAPQSCGDKSKADKDIDTPAGWMILQSFSTIHNVSANYH